MEGVLRAILLLAPIEFRERYGRELIADFREALHAERDAGNSIATFLVRAYADLLATIAGERVNTMYRTLTYTIRSLVRTPGVTLVMILTLALGIGANVAAFSVINGVLLHPLPYRDADRIMAVWRTTWINGIECRTCPHSPFTSFELRAHNTTFDSLAPYQTWEGIVSASDVPQRVKGAVVGAQLFDVLGVKPELGRAFTLADERYGAAPVVLVSHDFWQRSLHGDPAAIGRTILIDGKPVHVIGVVPRSFLFPNFTRLINERPDVFRILVHEPGLKPGNNGFGMVGHLKPGVTPAQAQSDLSRVVASLAKRMPMYYGSGSHVDAIRILPLAEDLLGPSKALLFPVLGAVFIVLLVACLNVANLLIARAVGRQRELAMRLAIGASARHVLGQIAVESLVLSIAAAIAGVFIARYAIAAYVALSPPGLHRADQITIDWSVVAYALGIALLTATLTSILPALACLRTDIFSALKDGRSRIGGRGAAVRATLVVLQVACTFALIVGCGLMVHSFTAYASSNLGYNEASLVDISGPPLNAGLYPTRESQFAYIERLRRNLSTVPGVGDLGFGTAVPLEGGGSDGTFDIVRGVKGADADFEFVSPGYFAALALHPVMGREFTTADRVTTQPVAVVSEEFVKRFIPDRKPIGKIIDRMIAKYTIVGVVPDVRLHYATEPRYPSMYFSVLQIRSDIAFTAIPFFVRTSIAPSAVEKSLIAAWQAADPREPAPVIRTVPEIVQIEAAPMRANALILGALALLALILAISGTASVVAYAVARRTNEIGVRMALGARRWRIVGTLLSGAAIMSAIGLGIGLGLAALTGQGLQPQLYETPVYDPSTYVAVALILIAATMAASFVPAYRAATLDPSKALRYE
jgi:predicted permease